MKEEVAENGSQFCFNLLILMVGAEGFEPPTLCSQSRCATRLRYAPTIAAENFTAGNSTAYLIVSQAGAISGGREKLTGAG